MPHPNPYPLCVFCGAKANSREHAIPAWMSKRLRIRETLDVQRGNLPHRKQPISFASYRSRIFCRDCNTHFKHLEDRVIPLLVPMATGRTLSLNADSQALLALWATKTAIALVASSPDLREFVPQDQRDSVRYSDAPPDRSWVGFFPWCGAPVSQIFVGDNELTAPPEHPAAGCQSWMVVFAFKFAGFKAMGLMDPLPDGYTIGSAHYPIAQFWPSRPGMVHWPTTDTVTQRDFASVITFAPIIPG